ncbi:MAG: protein-glutamate O-methyltransferase CheR [Thiomargarita sp.]|nr:protein-glutamate O-methyltransferase CheR [Thiomargarita sp.]
MDEREFRLTEHEFNLFRNLINKHTGISLSNHKQEMLYSRLAHRLRALNLDNFYSYYKILKNNDTEELAHFIHSITTHTTAFFRESHHFESLETQILPKLLIKNQKARRIRIWSAGCATGEEAYSIAIIVKKIVPANWDVKILATDIDPYALMVGQQGIYGEERITGVSPLILQRWFRKGIGEKKGQIQILLELQQLIVFKYLNLMDKWPMKGLFDIIFCRNVAIYFDKNTQIILFNRFADIMNNNAHLLIGHSENLFQLHHRFYLLGRTIYIKHE